MSLDVGGTVAVSERVRQRAEHSGADAQQWLKDLPERLHELERAWQIRTGPAAPGGSAAFVANARTSEGVPAIIKLAMPGCELEREVETLLRAKGNGYVKLLRYDLARSALLLEALGSPMQFLDLSAEQRIVLLCQTLKQAWLLAPAPGQAIEYRAQRLSKLITSLWETLHHPCSEAIIDQALAYAERRSAAFDPDHCLVVHGDPHSGNALEVISARAGAESGFVFIDPDGFLCEPEYDLGVILRDWCPQLLAESDSMGLARWYCKRLAQQSHLQEDAIWEWGFIERVSTGLYSCAYGSVNSGQPFFDSANRLLAGAS